MAGSAGPMTPGGTPHSTPAPIVNRPSLRAIEYRIGTYATFRRTMLEQIARWERAADPDAGGSGSGGSAVGATKPLAAWTTRSADDFGIAFLEMWAYLGDILTFYQERIANEAYLRTSVQARSTAMLVSLIGYRPGPGRAAVAHLAFETERDATVALPAGLLVQSVPGQDEKPQKFETLGELTAFASLNALRPRTLERQTLPRGATRVTLAGVDLDITPGDWIVIAGDARRKDPGSEQWDVRRVAQVVEDPATETTTLDWIEGLGSPRRPGRGAVEPEPNPEIWVFRGQAWPFGYNAPDYRMFTIGSEQGKTLFEGQFKENWNDRYLPHEPTRPDHLYLDTVYPGILEGSWVALVAAYIEGERDDADRDKADGDPGNRPKGLTGYDDYVELYPVMGAVDTAYSNFLLSGRSTRVTLDQIGPEQLAARLLAATSEDERTALAAAIGAGSTRPPEHIEYFPMRATTVLVGAERLALAEVPLGYSALGDGASQAMPVQGPSIELDGVYPDLRRGRTLVVSGTLLDAAGRPIGPGSEVVTVAAVDNGDWTTIRFGPSMVGRYERGSVVIYGNVAAASHGESVKGEVLGDGNAAQAFQAFPVKKLPVTHIPAPGAPGGVASTLEVRVDGVLWTEVPELYGRPADARVYMARRDETQATRVLAGDGVAGARIPSGRGNVTADYRVGLGAQGNVGAGTLRTLLKKPLGLKRVNNPAAAGGGAEPEDPAAVKENAPGTVRTFGRIVSVRDFEDAAREYVGVAKARASFVWHGEARVVSLVVAGIAGATVDIAASGLLGDLDTRRDPHQPLIIKNFERRPIEVRLSIQVDEAYVSHTVRQQADAALRELLAFDARDLGEAIHLSDVHRAVQRVAGVVAVDVDVFRFKPAAGAPTGSSTDLVKPRLLVAPNELVWVEDPDDLRVIDPRHPDEPGAAA